MKFFVLFFFFLYVAGVFFFIFVEIYWPARSTNEVNIS